MDGFKLILRSDRALMVERNDIALIIVNNGARELTRDLWVGTVDEMSRDGVPTLSTVFRDHCSHQRDCCKSWSTISSILVNISWLCACCTPMLYDHQVRFNPP